MRKNMFARLFVVVLTLAMLCIPAAAVGETEEIAANLDTGEIYSTLEAALTAAAANESVVLMADYELADSAAVPAGVTLVIPTSDEYDDVLTGNNANGEVVNGSAYVTLTVPEDVTLTVNGTLLVAGNQQSTNYNASCLTGDYGKIDVAGNLEVNGTLYARGEISGTGTVTANDGAKVYQMLQIRDWRGGTATMGAYGNDVFPFNVYEFDNITAKTVYMYGSSMEAHYYIYANSKGNEGDIVIIGNGGQLVFENTAAGIESGSIVFTNTDGVTNVVLNGAVKTGDIAITIKQTIFGFTLSYTIDSSKTVCPFGYNMNVEIANGGTLMVNSNLKLLPGCTFTVKEGGTLTVAENKTLYVYADGGYNTSYYRHETNNVPIGTGSANMVVENGATVSGTIASTDAAFGNVDGYTATENTVTVKEVTQANTDVTVVPVTFYVGTNAASAAEEEPAAEEAVEEIVEEPVEEIVEISEELVEAEEAVIAE